MDQPPDTPRIGVDEWVASVEGRRDRYSGLRGAVQRRWDQLPPAARVLAFAAPAAAFPFLTTQGNVFRYGLFTLVYALLALGLNIVVGFAGLLDLGYVAFFGIGAYLYAILASPQFGHHWQAVVAVPVVVIGTAFLGLLVGLPSRRLFGDYLAILTLFFGQIYHFMGFIAGLKGFTAAVIGGIGSIPGAMAGGLIVGLAESYATGYLPQGSTFQNLYVFALLILVILIRPSGLFGRAAIQKV